MAIKRCPSCLREYDGANCSCGFPEKGQNAAHQLPVGTVLRGRYQIGKALGQGGFGITYLAWDTLMQEKVAVKEFYPGGIVFRRSAVSTAVECSTEEIIPHYKYSKERFLREANALVKFKDIPEVVDILDFAEDNNTAYIVMEFVRGVDLAKYIAMKGGKLSVEETFRILRPVMEALAKVHKGGIVHRDISPDNIVLDPVGGAKLLDFGAVRIVEDPDVDKGLAKSTEAILKQGFAPLEQYNSRGSLGPWTDEYAVCATIWYCLTGRVPEEVTIRMAEGSDPDWSTIEGLPIHQQLALRKGISCLAKDRYRSLDELLAALFPAEEVPVPVEEPAETLPNPVLDRIVDKRPRPLRKWGWIMGVAAVLIIAIAAAAILFTAPKEALPPQVQAQTQAATEDTQPVTEETEPTTEPPSEEEQAYLQAEQLLAEGKLGEAAIAFGKLAGYADARERSFEIWAKIAPRDTVSTTHCHTVGLRIDGTVVAVGLNENGQCDLEDWTDIDAVSAGAFHTLGLKTDHTVVAVGFISNGRCDVGAWTDIVSVSAGFNYSVGLRVDGTVVATGNNEYGQCDLGDWTDIVAVSAGGEHTVGLKADGTVVAMGKNDWGQCDVGDWTDIVMISCGTNHTVGIKSDGTAISVGYNDEGPNYLKGGRCDVGDWTSLKAVSGGGWFTVGLTTAGNILLTGDLRDGRSDAYYWLDIVAISTGTDHIVGLRPDGKVWAAGRSNYGCCNVSTWKDILVREHPLPFR